MTILQALILGAVQGLTEFLPISSSGHLVLVPVLFGWQPHPLVFDTFLHLGTTMAVVIYFWRDLLGALRSTLSKDSEASKNRNLLVLLIVGSIPAGIIGFLFEDYFELYFRSVTSVAIFLLLGSVLMFLAEKLYTRVWDANRIKDEKSISWQKSLIIGLFQSLALFSGFSRSGSSISGGMLFGLSREMAARFSFLLSVPIVVVAATFKIYDSFNLFVLDGALVGGFFASFVSGYIAIDFLLKFLKSNKLYVFIVYRVILAVVLLAV